MNQGKTEAGQDCLYFYAKSERGETVLCEFQISGMGVCMLQVKSEAPHMITLA